MRNTINVTKAAALTIAVLALILGGAGRARAGLIGSTVNSTYYYPSTSSVYQNDGTQVVAPTATFNAFGEVGEVVSDTQIVITNTYGSDLGFTPASFNGPIFDFLGSGTLISGVTVDGATNVPFTASDITLASDGMGGQLVELNLQGLSFPTDANVTVDVATGTAAPEPASLTLLGVGFAGLMGFAGVRRRKKAAQAA